MIRGRKKNGGFTLVELMIVVAIIGILAAIAIPAFSRYVKKSKTAEASGHINKMWAGSVAYWEADHANAAGQVVAKQFPTSAAQEPVCCGQTGNKCAGNATVYSTDVGWVALNFGIADPHYYMPIYTGANTGPTATFTARVDGDLDCDTNSSLFQRLGAINSSMDVYSPTGYYIVNEIE